MRLGIAILAVGLVTVFGVVSCKKDITEKPSDAALADVEETVTNDDVKDSTLLNTRDIYLWYNQIPENFDPSIYDDPDAIMAAIRPFSNEPGYTTSVDRWSYALKKSEWDNLSIGLNMQADEPNKDFGLNVFFRAQGDLRVRYVEKNSPAGLAGIRRGWKVTSINGNTNITTGNADFIVSAVYESGTGSFTFQKPNGASVNVTLTSASYHTQPVVLDSVYSAGNKKVGYLVLNSFIGDTAAIFSDFQRVFSKFARQQVNELVVDLRYNGGGYVAVQDKLANYLVKNGVNGQVMMSERFNDKHSSYNNTTRFNKLGTVNVSRISFIVSSNTASASELLINNLKPYMDVRLVGPSRTHGKPVGFFPIPVGDWYIFPVSFRSVNKNGEGNYFNGLELNNQVVDGTDKDWGDRSESALGFILSRLAGGVYRSSTTTVMPDPEIEAINKKLSADEFKGAIDTRQKF